MNDIKYTIEKALPDDAANLLAYLKTVGGETDNLTFGCEGLPFDAESEAKYIESIYESKKDVMFTAKCDGNIIGSASLSCAPRERFSHRGELSVCVMKKYWGHGIGNKLIENVIDFAKNTAKCSIVTLEVRSDNDRAITLYKKHGFEKAGTVPGFMKIKGELIDCDIMVLKI